MASLTASGSKVLDANFQPHEYGMLIQESLIDDVLPPDDDDDEDEDVDSEQEDGSR